jgi:hypothetical protein
MVAVVVIPLLLASAWNLCVKIANNDALHLDSPAHVFSCGNLESAVSGIGWLAACTAIATTVASCLLFGLIFLAADSEFECEYATAPTLGNKQSGDVVLSAGVGVAVMLGLTLGSVGWWGRYFKEKSISSPNELGDIPCKDSHVDIGDDDDDEDWVGELQKSAFEGIDASESLFLRFSKISALAILLGTFAIAPNVGYVIAVLSDLPRNLQILCEVGITAVKLLLAVVVIPRITRLAVSIWVHRVGHARLRFRMRLVISTVLASITIIVIPITIVTLTDERCLNYSLFPQPKVTTDFSVEYCEFSIPTDGREVCREYAELTFSNNYVPSFEYSGGKCVSAVVEIYAPVFLTSILLIAIIPAAFEVFLVPKFVLWFLRRGEMNMLFRNFQKVLRSNVSATLTETLATDGSIQHARLNNLAQYSLERGFSQLLGTLLVALTFGIAAPIIGVACAFASIVQALHHRHILREIFFLGASKETTINIKGCSTVPVGCGAVVVITVLLVWLFACVGFLNLGAFCSAAAVVLLVAALAIVFTTHMLRRSGTQSTELENQRKLLAEELLNGEDRECRLSDSSTGTSLPDVSGVSDELAGV